jgi:putative acetyltransferase
MGNDALVDGIVIRPETGADIDAVHAVVAAAFERQNEARLVDVLRLQARPFVSFVAEVDNAVVGHISFTEVEIAGVGAMAMGLAPLSVTPRLQRRGVGSALMKTGLAACQSLAAGLVFVLGHADYYPRFGFRPAAECGFYFMKQGGEPSFFVLELIDGAGAGRAGKVQYHAAFGAV